MEHRRSRLGGSCGQPSGGCPSPVGTGRHVPPRRGLADHDGATASCPSRSTSRMMVSQSGHVPPSPTERPNNWHSEQRRSPRDCSPHFGHSYTVCATSCRWCWSCLRMMAVSMAHRLVTQLVGELFTGRCAIEGATARWHATAYRAGSCNYRRTRRGVTRTVTCGV